jgi:hypothetical protein
MGYIWKIGRGDKVRFWEDNWLGSSSLVIPFWKLYRIVNEKNATVDEVWNGSSLKCSFRRNMDDNLEQQWEEVCMLASTITFSSEEDSLIWKFSSSGLYSTQSLYRVINFRGIQLVLVPALWSIKVPPRVHFFLWLVSKNKVLTRDNLGKRRKVKDPTCLFCCESETVHHLFFDCVVATQLWKVLSVVLNVNLGGSLDEVGKYWLSNKKHCVTNITSSAAIWSIRKLRNNLCFQISGWKSTEILYQMVIGMMQNWLILCPAEHHDCPKSAIAELKLQAKMSRWLLPR